MTYRAFTCDEINGVATIHTMSVGGFLVMYLTVWSVSTLLLSRLPWFQRREQRGHPDNRADGACLAEQAETWLSSLHDATDPNRSSP